MYTFHTPLVSAKQILIFLVLQQEIVIFLNFRDIISTFDCLVKDLEIVRVISPMKDNKQILKHREMLARRYFNQESGRI